MATGQPKEEMSEEKDAVGRLGRNNRLSLIGSVVNGAAGFIVVLVLTNGLGEIRSGVVWIGAAVFNIAMQTSVLGTDASLVRFIAQDRKAGRPGSISTLLRAALRPVIGIGIALSVAAFIFAEPIARLFVGEGEEVETPIADVETAIRVVAVILPIGAVAMALLAATRGFGQVRTTTLFDQIARPITQLIGVAAVVLLGLGPVAATAAWVGPIAISAIAAGTWLRKAMPESDGQPVDTSDFWSFTRPQAGTGMLRVAVRWLDTLVVGALLGLGPASIYTSSTRLLKLGDFFNQATFQSTAPQIAEDLSTGNITQANTIYRNAATWLALATWPLYLGTLFYAPEMLRLFGEEFVQGAPALQILATTSLFAAACGPIEAVFVMSGRTTQNLIFNTLALALNVGLGFALIPSLGLEGAAIAWAVSMVTTNLLPLIQVYRNLGIHPFSKTHLSTMAAVSIGFAVTAAITRALDLPTILTLVVGLGLAAIPWAAFAYWRRDELALEQLLRSRSKKPQLAQEQS